MKQKELERIISRTGYGVKSNLKARKSTLNPKASNPRSVNDVESVIVDELEGPEVLQIKCSGKIRVRIKFYRHRLADYSRAISEKALIDSLQYSGLIRGDSEKEIWLIDEGQEKVEKKEDERTEIVLEYPELDLDDLWEARNRKDGR